MSGFDYSLLKKPEAYGDSKGTVVGRPLFPSEVHGNIVALADAINAMLGPLTQAQFGSRTDATKMWVPVNFVYIQFPGMSLPSDLMAGTWTNISSNFANDFFRAEGSVALPFEGGEQAAQNKTHSHGASCGYDSPDHSHVSGIAYGSGGAICYAGANQNTAGNISTGGASSRHAHAITLSNDGGADLHPINRTIRIWKKTA